MYLGVNGLNRVLDNIKTGTLTLYKIKSNIKHKDINIVPM
jgi:hypothetical protein